MNVFVALLSLAFVAAASAGPQPIGGFRGWALNVGDRVHHCLSDAKEKLTEVVASAAENKGQLVLEKVNQILPVLKEKLEEAKKALSLAASEYQAKIALQLASQLEYQIKKLEELKEKLENAVETSTSSDTTVEVSANTDADANVAASADSSVSGNVNVAAEAATTEN